MWMSEQPGLVGQRGQRVGRLELALVGRVVEVVARGDPVGARWTAGRPGPCGTCPTASRRPAGSTGSRPCRTAGTSGSTSVSMPRTSSEYGGCSVTKRSRPRRSATHCASTIWLGREGRASRRSGSCPGADQVGQRRQRLVDVGVRLGPVDLVEVDPVGAAAGAGLSRPPGRSSGASCRAGWGPSPIVGRGPWWPGRRRRAGPRPAPCRRSPRTRRGSRRRRCR